MAHRQSTEKQVEQSKETPLILTNAQKIKIIDGILKDFNNTNALQVSLTYQPIKKQNKQKSIQTLFQYNIPGSKFKHKSKNSNLVSKLQQMQKTNYDIAQEKQSNIQSCQQSPIKQVDEVENQITNFKNEDNFRYFKDNIVCFKCNKAGHYRSVCPQITTCMYCFSPAHEAQTCPQKNVCFRCYGFGHVYANCKVKQSFNKCHICQKHHDNGCNFLLTKIRDGAKRKQFYDNIYNHKDIQCIKCFNYGHIDCPM